MSFYVGSSTPQRNMGTYAAGTTYFSNDLVQYNGSTYIAVQTTTGNLPTNTTYWAVFAAKGVDGQGVPAGGTTNQVLAKTSNNDYAVGWVAAGGGAGTSSSDDLLAPTYKSQYWHSRRIGSTEPGQSWSTVTPTTSKIYYSPLYMHKAVSIDRIGVLNGGSAPTSGAAVRIGLYTNVAATGLPGTLVYDWGLLNLGTTANVTLTMAASGTLPKGFSWVAFSFNGTSPGSLGGVTPTELYVPLWGLPDAQFSASSVSLMAPNSWTQTGNASASALDATAAATLTYAGGALQTPEFFYRVT